jgi:hypothetical protein
MKIQLELDRRGQMMLKKTAALLAVAYLVAPMALADDYMGENHTDKSSLPSWIKDTSGVGQSQDGVVRSNQILELGIAPANGLQLEGESMLRRGDLEGALVVLQRAVEQAPMDIEKRILYAQCLEKKLVKSKKKDPALYNFLVKQWLFIFKKAEFADQAMAGKGHLYNLTGTFPKAFERERTFLARVLIPEDAPVKSAHKAPATEAAAKKEPAEQ